MRFNKNPRPLSLMTRNWRKSWSGREDSNLRPLPPENDAPARTDANPSLGLVLAVRFWHLFLICARTRFKPNLGALSPGGAI